MTVVVVIMAVMLVVRVKVVVVATPTSHPCLFLHMLGEKHRFPSPIFQNIQRGHLWGGQAVGLQLEVSWGVEVPEVPKRVQEVVGVMVMAMVDAKMSIRRTSRVTVISQVTQSEACSPALG